LRRALLAEGRALEAPLTPADLAGEFYLGNSLRGLVRGHVLCPRA
jgi:para-aminobenzoate synthetase/4-amino-4-deoxychorismate lyase